MTELITLLTQALDTARDTQRTEAYRKATLDNLHKQIAPLCKAHHIFVLTAPRTVHQYASMYQNAHAAASKAHKTLPI